MTTIKIHLSIEVFIICELKRISIAKSFIILFPAFLTFESFAFGQFLFEMSDNEINEEAHEKLIENIQKIGSKNKRNSIKLKKHNAKIGINDLLQVIHSTKYVLSFMNIECLIGKCRCRYLAKWDFPGFEKKNRNRIREELVFYKIKTVNKFCFKEFEKLLYTKYQRFRIFFRNIDIVRKELRNKKKSKVAQENKTLSTPLHRQLRDRIEGDAAYSQIRFY